MMTKIVYNACFGGFGLSEAAIIRYAEIKGIKLFIERGSSEWSTIYYTEPVGTKNRKCLYDKDIPRADPALVQVVEELGDKANGRCANLSIEEVPSGISYRIDEYDGSESVQTKDSYDWEIA